MRLKWGEEKGQAMVETALVIPILLLLLFGVIDVSRVLHASLTVENAAREGARLAALGGSDAEVSARAAAAAFSLPAEQLVVAVDPPEGGRTSGGTVTVSVDYSVPILAPMIGDLIGSPFPVSGSSSTRVE